MARTVFSSLSFSDSGEFYRQLIKNDGHMFEGRNPTGSQEIDNLPEALPGYCSECGSSLVYPQGVAVCPKCCIEYPGVVPLANDVLIPKTKGSTRAHEEEREIYYRERDEKDVTGNL